MRPEQAFAEFYRAAKDPCLRAVTASGTDRAAAEEAVAEAFARAWAGWPKVSKHPAPAAWVVRTALNHHVSHWRRTRREVVLDETVRAVAAPPAEVTREHQDLIAAVRALPPRQREVIALRIFLDLDTAQTSQVLGIAEGTVTAHLHRAMTALRGWVLPTKENAS